MSKKGHFFKRKTALKKRIYKSEIGVLRIGVAKVYKRILGKIKPLFIRFRKNYVQS